MSSDLQSVIAAIQLNNYLSITTASVIAYDYIITFAKEINYVWGRSWTVVSTLFVIVRYSGFFIAIWQYIYTRPCFSTILIIAANWAFIFFLAAADLVMILRVYAMYQGSRIILGVLLLVYAPTIILLAISTGINNNPKTSLSVNTPQVLDFTFCSITYTSSGFGYYAFIPRFILAALMFTLSLCKFIMESVQAYKATKRWMPNRYMTLLVREGVLYFSAHLLYNINALSAGPTSSNNVGIVGILTDVLSFVLLFILCPRFIMSVREMYDDDCRHGGRRGSMIDSGFGLPQRWQAGSSPAIGSIRFADGELSMVEERAHDRDIEMVDVRTIECH